MSLGVVTERDPNDAGLRVLHDKYLREGFARFWTRCAGENFDRRSFWIGNEMVELIGNLETLRHPCGNGMCTILDAHFEFAEVIVAASAAANDHGIPLREILPQVPRSRMQEDKR